jgi:thymidine phosphorylase
MVVAQGGEPSAFENADALSSARLRTPVGASSAGYIADLDALTVARASIVLGAGRERKGDPIDLAVGVELHAKVGSQVERGQPIATLHANDEARLAEAERVLQSAVRISATHIEPPPLILERLVPSER